MQRNYSFHCRTTLFRRLHWACGASQIWPHDHDGPVHCLTVSDAPSNQAAAARGHGSPGPALPPRDPGSFGAMAASLPRVLQRASLECNQNRPRLRVKYAGNDSFYILKTVSCQVYMTIAYERDNLKMVIWTVLDLRCGLATQQSKLCGELPHCVEIYLNSLW